MRKVVIPFTTSAGGAADVLSEVIASGEVVQVWIDTGDTPSTTDYTITESGTAAPIFAKSNVASDVLYPIRTPLYDTAGVALDGAYGAPVVADRLRLVVAQGGNAKSGTVIVYVDGELIAAPRGD